MNKYSYAKGRRKTSVATVRLYTGEGQNIVNEKKLEEYFPLKVDQNTALEPLRTLNKQKDFYVTVSVRGGGKKSQQGAISHALARALVVYDPSLKSDLKRKSLLTRDSRMVERKKTGYVKARKAPQFSKR